MSFSLKPLTEKVIEKMNLPLSDLWLIKINGEKVFGPFDTEQLVEAKEANQSYFEKVMVFNLESEKWQDFYKVIHFQRRKPKLVSVQALATNDQFLVKFNNEQFGPFDLESLINWVENNKVPLNCMFSIDQGETWNKLYEHHAFDRRIKQSRESLPTTPQGVELAEISIVLDKNDNQTFDLDSIIQIATSIKTESKPKPLKAKVKKVKSTSNKSSKNKVYATVFGVLFVLVSASFYMFNSNKGQRTPANEQIEQNNHKRQQKKNLRTTKKKTRSKKRTSISRAKPFIKKDRRNFYDAPEQDSYNEKYENEMDIDDPAVREELTRQLANDESGEGEGVELNSAQVHYLTEESEMPYDAIEEDM